MSSDCKYYIMVDMDHTLIESVFPNDAQRYSLSKGKLITHDDVNLNFKVNIRPGAVDMVKTILQGGHRYILWSAGTKEYVHSVMKYFSREAGVGPEKIYTREDMVPVETNLESVFGNKFKANTYKGIKKEELLIIDDDSTLINPHERDRLITVKRWNFESGNDGEMNRVIQLINLYGMTSRSSCHNVDIHDQRVIRSTKQPRRSMNSIRHRTIPV